MTSRVEGPSRARFSSTATAGVLAALAFAVVMLVPMMGAERWGAERWGRMPAAVTEQRAEVVNRAIQRYVCKEWVLSRRIDQSNTKVSGVYPAPAHHPGADMVL